MMEEIHIKIGRKLNSIRKMKGLSLDKLADITGVSKSMLGQMERGESIPTVTTLWKIAKGLNISFSTFVEEDKPSVSIISKDELKPIYDDDLSYRVYPLFPYDANKKIELYTIEIDPNSRHEASPHNAGVEEYILVTKGTLEIMINKQIYRIAEGNAVKFTADTEHIYQNSSNELIRMNVIIYYP